jgi:hypothetical protein
MVRINSDNATFIFHPMTKITYREKSDTYFGFVGKNPTQTVTHVGESNDKTHP